MQLNSIWPETRKNTAGSWTCRSYRRIRSQSDISVSTFAIICWCCPISDCCRAPGVLWENRHKRGAAAVMVYCLSQSSWIIIIVTLPLQPTQYSLRCRFKFTSFYRRRISVLIWFERGTRGFMAVEWCNVRIQCRLEHKGLFYQNLEIGLHKRFGIYLLTYIKFEFILASLFFAREWELTLGK